MAEQTEETKEAVQRALEIRNQGIPVGERGLVLRTVADMTVFSKLVFDTGLAPSGFKSPQQIFVAVQMGAELGLAPMASLRTIAVINGRPAIWGGGMMGVVEASGVLEWKKEWLEGLDANDNPTDKTVAYCTSKRIGKAEAVTTAFSVGDAKKAGLWGGKGSTTEKREMSTWFTYPKRMLQMRARSRNLNDEFSDVLHGLLTAEEVEDMGTFDTDKVNGAKRTEVLTQRITDSVPVEAGGNEQDAPESTGHEPVDESKPEVDAHGNVISGTDGSTIHIEGPDVPAIEDSELPEHGKRPEPEQSEPVGEPKAADLRFAQLIEHVAATAELTLDRAETVALRWLKRYYPKTSMAFEDTRFDLLIWPKVRKVDWKKEAAA